MKVDNELEEKLMDAARASTDGAIDIAKTMLGDIVFDGVLGTVAPGVVTSIFSYKQRRLERNLQIFTKKIFERIDIIEEELNNTSITRKKMIKNNFAGIICDYVIEEKEVNKVRYMANGFVSLVQKEKIDESTLIEFYNILLELREIELILLIDYHTGKRYKNDTMADYDKGTGYLQKLGLTKEEENYINLKLERLVLLDSRNKQKVYTALVDIIKKIEDPERYRNSISFNIYNSRYSITDLGRNIVNFFRDEFQK